MSWRAKLFFAANAGFLPWRDTLRRPKIDERVPAIKAAGAVVN